ncbi:MAG TPA: lytic murein transglycosylase [Syntrophorhabdaceae bacterium]|nr:lytic murein transglycosylase [Syntrophorhabdaceae bacterium]HPU29038.1 lytic murein transglycosylase [Syntrophorhabdaceae bacterium]
MNFFRCNNVAYLVFLFIFVPFIDYAIEIDIVNVRPSLFTKLKNRGLDNKEIMEIFSDERISLYPEILEKKGKGINYMDAKFGLLSKRSIKKGKILLKEKSEILNRIQLLFGVDKEILVAIYRLETNFGSYTGRYSVFNSLLTLTLIENRRCKWAEDELVNFIILCKAHKKDLFAIKGSWAGAFGLCQFVPTAFLEHAVDGDGNGTIDLFDFNDAMASIANYLKNHGWESGDIEKKKKAIWYYNRCNSYVKAVFLYADAIKSKRRF